MTASVLGISGSPHRHGNTEMLLDAFLEGAEHAGAEIEKVVLKSLDYSSCRGCNVCHKTGACTVHDALDDLFAKILAADCLAVASPIYSMGITAELKGVIDRAQYLWARKFIVKDLYFSHAHIMRHKGIFLSTAGLGWDNVFDAAFPAMTAFFNTTGFEYLRQYHRKRYGSLRGHPWPPDGACRGAGEGKRGRRCSGAPHREGCRTGTARFVLNPACMRPKKERHRRTAPGADTHILYRSIAFPLLFRTFRTGILKMVTVCAGWTPVNPSILRSHCLKHWIARSCSS